MTNFSSQRNRKNFLTPEKAVFFIPVLAGIAVSSILLPLIFFPSAKFIREQKADIQLLNDKVAFIPEYKLKLAEIESIFRDINNQNNRLIDLLAGKKDLTTVLSKLNTIASNQDVKIIEVKPKDKMSTLLTINESKEIDNSSAKSTPTQDKLLVKSIEKYPIDLKVVGNYIDILNFIRDLELLQTIVLSSNLKLVNTNPSNFMPAFSRNSFQSFEDTQNYITLDFTITFYGRKTTVKSLRKQELINSLKK